MEKNPHHALFLVCLSFVLFIVLFNSCKNADPEPPSNTATVTATGTIHLSPTATRTFTVTLTATITPTATLITSGNCVYAYGYGGDNDNHGWGAGVLVASPFIAGSITGLNQLVLKIGNENRFAAGVYSDNSGVPGTKLAETGGVTCSSGWNAANLLTACTLTGGNTYWIVAVAQNSGGIRDYDASTVSEKVANSTYTDVLPSDISGLTWYSYAGYEMKAYAFICY